MEEFLIKKLVQNKHLADFKRMEYCLNLINQNGGIVDIDRLADEMEKPMPVLRSADRILFKPWRLIHSISD